VCERQPATKLSGRTEKNHKITLQVIPSYILSVRIQN
jgi:hypothetical protein